MHHYIIACDELPERRDAALAHVKEVFAHGNQAYNLRYTFSQFRAFHGKTWGIETTKEYDTGKRISPGHVALNMTHWALWNHYNHCATQIRMMFESYCIDPFVVFEDDVKLPRDYAPRLRDLLSLLDLQFPEWEFVFLGLAEQEPAVWNKVTARIGGNDSPLCQLDFPFGTHAYMVKPSAIPKLLDAMTVAEKNMDQQLYERVLRPGLVNWCAHIPSIVRQRTYNYGDGLSNDGSPEWGPSCIDTPTTAQPSAEAPARGRETTPEEEHQNMVSTLSIIDPYNCLYRGEPLEEQGAKNTGDSVGVPLWDCALLGAPCHQKDYKPGVDVNFRGSTVLSCKDCTYRSAIAAPLTNRPKLPLPDGHFNPGMIVYKDRLILATRDSWGHSRIALWELTNDNHDPKRFAWPQPGDWEGQWRVKGISSCKSNDPDVTRLEDPRLFIMPTGELAASVSIPNGYPAKTVNMGYVVFSEDLTRITRTEKFDSPTGSAYEKNWMPFVHWDSHQGYIGLDPAYQVQPKQTLMWCYQYKPVHVVMEGTVKHESDNPFPWSGGALRGGAPPVHLPDRGVYRHFFHGCLKKNTGNIYTVGCLEFEDRRPFRVVRQTPNPLLWPDLPGPGEKVMKRYVMWPGGAVLRAGVWYLALGIDDTNCRIKAIPDSIVESSMESRPEAYKLQTIRDTDIANGVKPL